MRDRIYLDWNATAPPRSEAVAVYAKHAALAGNPSSVHAEGRAARGLLESARETVAGGLGVRADQIVFTSGGTEALALALKGTKLERTLVAATEHSAVLAAAPDAETIPVDTRGIVDTESLKAQLERGPALVAIMHANNETGVIHPIGEIGELVAAHGGRLLTDAVQTATKMPIPAADYVAVSAHKIGAFAGTGALIVRCAEDLNAVQHGGGQERGLRGGTENLLGIIAFAAAVEASDQDWLLHAQRRRERFETRLLAAGGEIFGRETHRLPTTSMVRMPGVSASTQLIHFDLAGFAVSSGAACSSGRVAASHVLQAMGVSTDEAGEAIRVSTGWSTTDADVDAFADAWIALSQARKAA